jgi:hypothetical protein
MKLRVSMALLGISLIAGCNGYQLRYQANPQPQWANVYADYTLLQDAIGVSIDTDGRRLEEVFIRKADGTQVRPLNISYPGFSKSAAIGSGLGFGAGHVGFGTGIGIPIGPDRARGLTTATFSTAALGPAPWELHIKLQGVAEAVIPGVGGPATAK